jgi:hypothetical protein
MNSTVEWSSIPGSLRIAFIALAAAQIAVQIYALARLIRTPEDRLVFGKKWPWVLIILFVNLIGAVVFLAAGRKPPAAVDPLDAPSADAPPVTPGRAARAAEVLYGPRDGDAS